MKYPGHKDEGIMFRRSGIVGFLVVVIAVMGSSMAGSDFSGTWKLNLRESWFGMLDGTGSLFGPSEAMQQIEQLEQEIRIKLVQKGGTGEINADLVYRLDGSECINELEGYKLTSRAEWEGERLHINGSLEMSPFYPELDDLWSLSPDGKKLIIERQFQSSSGGDTQKWVFDRQE